jgi:S-adenosyl-L-methionine hydrolase (adenosine-forming)
MLKPILTLTTDFGLTDHYVAAMKGVILGICPQAQIVDIAHQISPFEITEGSYVIAQAWKWFPKKTVHVVVVDPGVGSARRPILMEAGGHYFIAPDNGVLSMIYNREKHKVRLISNERWFRKPVSHTFHGRDIFAPSAAHIAAGARPSLAGKLIEDYLRPTFTKPVRGGKRTWNGQVLKIDHFGNLITNFHTDDFPDLERRNFSMSVGPCEVTVLARNYTETSPGELFVIAGSSGYYEVSINQGSAAKRIGCAAGGPVELMLLS